MRNYYLYHMHLEGNDSMETGYVGVCGDMSKRKYKHLNTPVNSITSFIISSGQRVVFTVLAEGSREYCLILANKLIWGGMS